jgi:hypothetical protein
VAALTAAGKILARRLLDWDRDRVARREAEGYDGTLYKERQDLAALCINADVTSWPDEVVDLFTVVMEVLRERVAVKEVGVGPANIGVARLSRIERAAYRSLAGEIGVLELLRAGSPKKWADDDGEGD